jgi:predicted O-methyltransferase YrrM
MNLGPRLRRLYVPDEHHATRWHNQRGERLSLAQLPDLVLALVQRIVGRSRGPWMNLSAVRMLESLLQPTVSVLELGGGQSSVWLAERCREVTTIEDNPRWAQSIRRAAAGKTPNLLVVEDSPINYLRGDLTGYDIAIVDDIAADHVDRIDKVRLLVEKGVPHIVLDDSDRWSRKELDRATPGYCSLLVSSWRSRPLHAVETAFFSRRDQS